MWLLFQIWIYLIYTLASDYLFNVGLVWVYFISTCVCLRAGDKNWCEISGHDN